MFAGTGEAHRVPERRLVTERPARMRGAQAPVAGGEILASLSSSSPIQSCCDHRQVPNCARLDSRRWLSLRGRAREPVPTRAIPTPDLPSLSLATDRAG